MNRRGDKAYLAELFAGLRARIPGLVLRTSIIAGLPYEDEAAFEELCDFLREQKFERAGVFPILQRRERLLPPWKTGSMKRGGQPSCGTAGGPAIPRDG